MNQRVLSRQLREVQLERNRLRGTLKTIATLSAPVNVANKELLEVIHSRALESLNASGTGERKNDGAS